MDEPRARSASRLADLPAGVELGEYYSRQVEARPFILHPGSRPPLGECWLVARALASPHSCAVERRPVARRRRPPAAELGGRELVARRRRRDGGGAVAALNGWPFYVLSLHLGSHLGLE